MVKKRGQESGSNAAALISIILGFIILYILFLPAEERAELLGEENGDDNGDGATSITGDNLTVLREFIGRLDYYAQNDYELDVPNVYLRETSEATVLKSVNPFTIRNGWFDKEFHNFTFLVEDLANTENALLSLSAKKHRGDLIVQFNGMKIYEYDIDTYDSDPISLSKEFLKQGTNSVSFSVTGVGWRFWRTNIYSFENVQVTADIADITAQESSNIFTLTGTEYYNIVDANLRFVPYCTAVSGVGRLDILINNRNVFSAVPICDDVYDLAFPTTLLNAGSNKISLRTQKGSYSVEQIKVYGDLKESKTITHYFEINSSVIDDIEDDDLRAMIYIDFTDDDEIKESDLTINGHKTYLDQYDESYSRDISSWLEEGNNYISIDPKSTLEIVELRIVLEET